LDGTIIGVAEKVGFYFAHIVISLKLGQLASNCMFARNLVAVYWVLLVPLSLAGAFQKQTPNRHQMNICR
jgi:hypothetical protein